jgi:hypothetical protein
VRSASRPAFGFRGSLLVVPAITSILSYGQGNST